jgi:hypothetical protein
MPESSSRKKKIKPSRGENVAFQKETEAPNPAWFAPVMFGFMLLGLAWIIVYYVSGATLPLGSAMGASSPLNVGNWNIAIGFGIAMVGFLMSTRWK